MKTDNITNLVFSEIDIKEDNFSKNNFTIYSLDILSEDSDENNNKGDIHSSSSENSIDLDDYNLDIKTSNDLNKIDLNDNSYCIDDSLNTSSLSDNGTGDFTQNYTSAFGNVHYSWCGQQETTFSGSTVVISHMHAGKTTSATNFITYQTVSGSNTDTEENCSQVQGDLA
mgnify:CR=1 FL=1